MFVVSTSGRGLGRPLHIGDTGRCAQSAAEELPSSWWRQLHIGDTGRCAQSGFASAGSDRFGLCCAGGRARAVGAQLVPDMGNQQT